MRGKTHRASFPRREVCKGGWKKGALERDQQEQADKADGERGRESD